MASLYHTKYTASKGADFSADASLISADRGAICENLIPDSAGYPEKRVGWETVCDYGAEIYGMWRYIHDGTEQVIVHAGDKIYKHGDTPTQLVSGINECRSSALMYDDKLYIMTGAEYLSYDGESINDLTGADTIEELESEGDKTDNGVYIPTTSFGGTGQTDTNRSSYKCNSTVYENVNMLTRWRKNTFLGSESASTSLCYYFDTNAKIKVTIGNDGYAYPTNIAVFVNGAKVTVSAGGSTGGIGDFAVICDVPSAHNFVEDEEVEAYCLRASVSQTNPEIVGKDNIEVYYNAVDYVDDDGNTVDYIQQIAKCRVINEYANYFFVTGNTDKPNYDWHSGFNAPTYFPDINYTKFGDNTPVMGYLNSGENQVIVKGGNPQGCALYLRSESTLDGKTVFPVKQMASGIDGVSQRGFCNLLNDDLFLTTQGIYAVTSLDLTNEKAITNRSYYIDSKLTKEENLENAVMCIWKNLCLCVVNSHCYILNADASKSYNKNGDLLYDCYYWTNIPAASLLPIGDTLYFGTAEGKLCKFKTDVTDMTRFNDDGVAITAVWATKSDDDGNISKYKTLLKRGNSITVKPFTRSSAHISVRTDSDFGREVKYEAKDIFDWSDIDFSRFTFNSLDTPQEIMLGTKIKKYKRLQIIIKNDGLNEGFGVFEIDKNYAYGNYAKR